MTTFGAPARQSPVRQLFKLALWRSSALALGILLVGCARTARFHPHPAPVDSPKAPATVTPVPMPLVPQRVIPGERMTYTITWFGIPVMRGELRVTEQTREGLVEVTGTAETTGLVRHFFGVHDRATVLVDSQTLLPARSELIVRHWARRTTETVTYDYAQGRAVSTGAKTAELSVTTETRDLLSASYALRASDLQEDRQLELGMIADGNRWTVAATPRRRGTLTMPQGTFPVLEVEMQSSWLKQYAGRESLWIWVTTDATRTPLMARITIPFVGTLIALMDDRHPAWPPQEPATRDP